MISIFTYCSVFACRIPPVQWRAGDDNGHRTASAPATSTAPGKDRSLRLPYTYLRDLRLRLLAAPVTLPDSPPLLSSLAKAEGWQKEVQALMRTDEHGPTGQGSKGKGKPVSLDVVNKLISEGETLVVEFTTVIFLVFLLFYTIHKHLCPCVHLYVYIGDDVSACQAANGQRVARETKKELSDACC